MVDVQLATSVSAAVRQPRGQGWRTAIGSAEVALYVATGLISTLVTGLALRIWRAELGVPFIYWGDVIPVLGHFKTVQETGWYEFQARLGAPSGQTFNDFPTADNLNLVAAKLLFTVVNNVGSALNLYYLIGFPLAAVAAVSFLRVCGVSRVLSLVLAVLYAVAPYHFVRGESHLWLASYYPVPLALVVVIWIVRGERLWTARGSISTPWRWLTGRAAATLVALVLLGTASTYYSAFVLILLATAGVIAFVRSRSAARLAGAASAGVLLLATMLINMAPDSLFQRANGLNTLALGRNPTEAEVYGLKLTSLISPVSGHRVESWRDLRATYDGTYPLPSEPHALGFVAAVGFMILLVVAVVALTGYRRRAVAVGASRALSTLLSLASLNLILFLSGTVGGFATLLSFVTGNLRAWNRVSIVIAALSLAAVGIVLDVGVARVRRAAHPNRALSLALGGAVSATVLVVGCWDQLVPSAVPDYAGSAAQYHVDAAWFDEIESALPAGSMVFQLPYTAYPESPPINGVYDSDQMKAFLHTTEIRWSGGGIKGRAVSDWPRLVAAQEPGEMVRDLAAADFAAIMLDRQALGTPDLETALQTVIGPPQLVREDGRYAFYTRGAARRALEAANDAQTILKAAGNVLKPAIAYAGKDIDISAAPDGSPLWTAFSPSSSIALDNAGAAGREVVVEVTLSAPGGTRDVRLTHGSRTWDVPVVAGAAQTRLHLRLPSGRSEFGVVAGPRSAELPAVARRIGVTVTLEPVDQVDLD